MNRLLQDLRYALRQLRKSPGFTAVALLTLALGLGVNCAIFTVVNAVLLRPLAYPDSQRIVVFKRTFPGDFTYQTSALKFAFWRQHMHSVDTVSAQYLFASGVNMISGGVPERLQSLRISADFFRTLGVQLALGRSFTSDEDRPGGPRAAIISYGLWQRQFGGDPAILSRILRLGGETYAVVGVAPAGFTFSPQADVWLPLRAVPDPNQSETTYRVLGRLRDEASLAQAQQEANFVGREFQREYPKLMNPEETLSVANYRDSLVTDVTLPLLMLQGAVLFVLLIACVNLANLLLSRSTTRRKEIAVRLAMGAGQFRLVRQLVMESLVLAVTGGTLGLGAAAISLPALLRLAPSNLPHLGEIHINLTVLAFSLLIAVATGLLFGVVPAIHASGGDIELTLQQNSGRTGISRGSRQFQRLLLLGEVSLSVVLLAGAALLIQTFRRLQSENPGFDSRGVLVAKVSLDDARYSKTAAVAQLEQQALERLESVPGVEAAATVSTLPTEPSTESDFMVEGNRNAGDPQADTAWRAVSPHYFEVMRIPLLQGRVFKETDTASAPRVVIINQTLAARFFPGQNPVGARILIGQRVGSPFADSAREIIGIVGDTKEGGLQQTAPSCMFVPSSQVPDKLTALFNRLLPLDWVVRSKSTPYSLAGAVQREIQSVAELPVSFSSMDDLLGASIAQQRFNMLLLGLFAALSLLLGSVGLYGVLSYLVAQRTQEIGIRMAIGASRKQVLWLILRYGMEATLMGIAIGLGAGLGLTRLIASMLYGIAPTDPFTFATAAVVLLAVALGACVIPALRATKVDPMVALRYE